MRTAAAVLAAALAALSPSAFAEGKGKAGGDEAWRACKADAERLCAGAPQVGMCMHSNWDKLSPECRAAKERAKKQWAKDHPNPMQEACGGDLERLCAGSEKPGMCLHEHWDELSPGCRAFKEGAKKEWESKGEGKHGKGEGKYGKGEKDEKKGKMSFEWSDKKKQAEEERSK